MAFLCLASLGIIYGDIGTSPLYAMRECFFGPHSVPVSEPNVLGVLSLIVWTLTLVVTCKYLLYILRADNDGEGGILALMSLVHSHSSGKRRLVMGMGLFGAALLYGDGVLTPAISVLSAVEGLEVATPIFKPYVVAMTAAILTLLFFLQKKGTSGIGALFGPVMVAWFLSLGVLGAINIAQAPEVLWAINPTYAVRFFLENGLHGYFVLGAVFLVATGSEALYADLGHFSRRPILITWFLVAGPGLVLNYFGQGALLLRSPEAAANPFYLMAPSWSLYPLVLLATLAAVIASQAVITGVFSLTRQAMQLGYAPRLAIIHTSSDQEGQIYVPAANWALWAATLTLVISFGSSSHLASAYGIAVSLTMVITTALAYFVSRRQWGWSAPAALAVTSLFLVLDFAFFGANIAKVGQGGWIPLVIALAVSLAFATWKKGVGIMRKKTEEGYLSIADFAKEAAGSSIVRVPGQAIFLCSNPEATPGALLHNIKHNKVLHTRNYILAVASEQTPRVPAHKRLSITRLEADFAQIVIRYGFMESPDVLAALYQANENGLEIEPLTASYFVSANTIVRDMYSPLSPWRMKLFRLLHRNALNPTRFFRLPPNRVIEIGRQIQL